MRTKKKIISLNVDSALALMQEIYLDISEQKSIASTITKKMLTFMKESEDMSVIGPVIKDQQKILNDCTEKKISLVKLHAVLLKQSNPTGKEGFTKFTLTDDDKKLLDKLVADDKLDDPDAETYKTK